MKAKCPQCSYETEAPTREIADRRVYQHIHFVHKKIKKNKKQDVSPKQKRKYTKKKVVATPTIQIKHCPQCGCNIEAVSIALNLTAK